MAVLLYMEVVISSSPNGVQITPKPDDYEKWSNIVHVGLVVLVMGREFCLYLKYFELRLRLPFIDFYSS